MPLIVEDGTGKTNADSFISVADATTYHSNRGNADWAALASDTVREQCLRKATDYMERAFKFRWAGYRTTSTQALSWPRADVPIPDAPAVFAGYPGFLESDELPVTIANACAELALKASAGELLADLTQMKTRVVVGPIETEYAPHSPQAKRYPAIEAMLAPYLSMAAGTVVGVRA